MHSIPANCLCSGPIRHNGEVNVGQTEVCQSKSVRLPASSMGARRRSAVSRGAGPTTATARSGRLDHHMLRRCTDAIDRRA